MLVALALVGSVLLGSTAPAVAATTGRQTFVVVLRDDTSTVYGSGPISGIGTFSEDPNNSDLVTFTFPDGSVTLAAPSTEESESFNEVACVGRFSFGGDYTIAHATGAYAGATGSGTFSGTGIFVG
ncbi:MAG TPA: hypothetical protein VM390_06020, partial [Acidimicrobiales bacterium]|nr:hypothetical protein [Acidimicrobiales bacterium]